LQEKGKMQIKAILFDFGDTLVSTEKFDYNLCLKKVHESLTKGKVTVPYEEYRNVYFDVRNRLYKESEESLREVEFRLRLTETLKHFAYSFRQEDAIIVRSADAFAEAFVPMMQMNPYVPRLLQQLKSEDYEIGLVSNFAHPNALRKTLKEFDIAKYFDALIISGEVGWRKPSPKIFKKALQTLGAKASETVFIGDSPQHDIEGAKNAGMKTILVKKPSINKDEELGNPDKRISELNELPKVLRDLFYSA
jgi:putative hydrolase of the HAD superfamily